MLVVVGIGALARGTAQSVDIFVIAKKKDLYMGLEVGIFQVYILYYARGSITDAILQGVGTHLSSSTG